VISTRNKVTRTLILSNNSVKHALSWSSHSHTQRNRTQHSLDIVLRLQVLDSVLTLHSRLVIDVPGLRRSHNRVNQQVTVVLFGSSDREFNVRKVEGVPGLEGNDSVPAFLLQFTLQLFRGESVLQEVALGVLVDQLEPTSYLVVLHGVVDVVPLGVVFVASLGVFVFELFVCTLDVAHVDVALQFVVEVENGDLACLLDLCCLRLVHVEVDRDREELAGGHAEVLAD